MGEHNGLMERSGTALCKLTSNHTPRIETKLNSKQELFVAEYLACFDAAEAYLKAGYGVKDREVAGSNGRRLLRNAAVANAIHEAQLARIERLELDADKLAKSFWFLYLSSYQRGDYGTAASCLDKLCKVVGAYSEHNRQKSSRCRNTDPEQLKRELEQMGFDYTRLNTPKSLDGKL